MVLGQWLERGLGQWLAPDPNYDSNPDEVDTKSLFWSMVAPDPNFVTTDDTTAPALRGEAVAKPSPVATESSTTTTMAAPSLFVPCASCQLKLCPSCQANLSGDTTAATTTKANPLSTPVAAAVDSTAGNNKAHTVPSKQQQQTTFTSLVSPRGKRAFQRSSSSSQLQEHVLEAANGLAQVLQHPTTGTGWKLFRFCASQSIPKEKTLSVIQKILQAEPHLLRTRVGGQGGGTFPDGFTPFMVAVHANNVTAAELIWEFCASNNEITQAELLQTTNLQGQTAFHIAAKQGHSEAIQFCQAKFLQLFPESKPPQDLVQHTPLAVALTSPEPKASHNKSSLLQLLYDPNDQAIQGPNKQPVQERQIIGCGSGTVVVGVAEMPGKRIAMEDYTKVQASPESVVLCVSDGHSDRGQVAQLVAEQLVHHVHAAATLSTIVTVPEWEASVTDICLQVDEQVQAQKSVSGGAVAILVAVTEQQLLVANIGDCRCILLQNNDNDNDDQLSVQALSWDHKPDRTDEMERIEHAGLTVVEESFQEKGETITIHKVALTETTLMACSRSFGDFEFKANATLDAKDQAVTAVPEITVRDRDPSQDAFVVAACDGLWDVMSNEEVGAFVQDRVSFYCQEQQPNIKISAILPMVGDELLVEALNRGTTDNVSVGIVALSKWAHRVTEHTLAGNKLDFAGE